MSPILRRGEHERARSLAAQRVDERLSAADDAWLDAHLAGCDACSLVASDYEADRLVLRSLRGASPEPPRDLWARTAAAIEAEATRGRGARGGVRPVRRVLGLPAAVFGPIAGLAVVAIVVGAALFNGAPLPPGVVPGATPIALSGANVAVLSRGTDGSIEIQTGNLHEVCPITADGCSVEPSFDTSHIATIGGSGDVEAVISPSRDRIVVIQRGTTGTGGVYVVPVRAPAPGATSTPTATPSVTATVATTAAATAVPSATPTDAAVASPTAAASPSATPTERVTSSPTASAEASPIASPLASPLASASASPAGSGGASAAPTPTTEPVEPSSSPGASDAASPAPVVSPSLAPTPKPSPTSPPSAAPTPAVSVTPRPDGAIQIASNVVVVAGPATYSADGTRFAFSARPADGSGGPDVYVWNTKDTVARAITTDHRSMFADWIGDDVLVSRVDGGVPSTTRVDAVSGRSVGEPSRRAWLPTLSPDGSRAAWWDGSVVLADDGVTWVPDTGRLVTGAWGDAGTDDVQAIVDGKVGAWQVRWDPAGTALAAWVAPKTGRGAGHLNLYRVDPSTGRADLQKPLLADEPALGAFTLDAGILAWSAPDKSQGRTVQVLAWKGDQVSRGELPADSDGTLVQ